MIGQQINMIDIGLGLHVRRIEYSETIPFIMGIHYARRMPCIQYAFGLFEGVNLIGIVTYGQPASPTLCIGVCGEQYKSKVLELNRLVILPEYNGGNFASMLVGQSLKMLPHGMIIVSYADWGGWHHVGYVYQATNWIYTGKTKARTDKYSEGHSRHYAKNETRRQPRSAKHRYVFFTGNKRERKSLRSALRYGVYPYPKGNSRHYNTKEPKGVTNEL